MLGYHLHRENNISIYTGKQYFCSEKYQRPCFRASPQSPQTAHEGGESPTPFPNLSLRVLKCPFRALSPCPIQILADLTEICNRIWRTGEWPTPWTQSLIITLPKKGNLQLCQNYRTISLISNSSKVMLKVILNPKLKK